MRVPLLVLVLVLAGCDSFGGSDAPAWAQAGARLTYDYTPGPDSLRYGFPRRALPATPAVVQMTVRESAAYGSVEASWYAPDGSIPRYEPYYRLPLYGDYLAVTERGIEVVIPRGCHGGLLSPPAGTTSYVRVPRVGRRLAGVHVVQPRPGRGVPTRWNGDG